MFTLHAPAFAAGEMIPKEFTCEGKDRSPELRWSNPPAGTKSFVLICDDPDAPTGTWTHWVAYDIPAQAAMLAAANSSAPSTMKEGMQSSDEVGYHGPCPPKGHGMHRYYFHLYAIDRETLGLSNGAERTAVEAAMHGHVVGTAEYMGRYERK